MCGSCPLGRAAPFILMATQMRSRSRKSEAGFVVSAEVLLIAVILVIGVATGWAKLRDQSIAEVNDSINALDAYKPGYDVFGTRWIVGGAIVGPTPTGPVTATIIQGGSTLVIPPGTTFDGTLSSTYAPAVPGVGETF